MGPSPWYWRTFPRIRAASGNSFGWLEHGVSNSPSYFIYLSGQDDIPRLIVGTHCRVFSIPPSFLGVWFPQRDSVRILCFDPDSLPPLPIPSKFASLDLRYHAGVEPSASIELPKCLAEGSHDIEFSGAFETVDELLTVQECPTRTEADPLFAVFSVRPKLGKTIVMPQRWFTRQRFQSWQWIARITRHPTTSRLIGDGVRLFSFALGEDGCDLAYKISEI
jgi:hypothetical protein